MKKTNAMTALWIIIIGLLTMLLFANCGGQSTQERQKKLAEKVLRLIRENGITKLPGSRFETNINNCLVEPRGGDRYRIVFRDSTFSTDLTALVNFFIKGLDGLVKQTRRDVPDYPDTAHIDEIEFLFRPGDDDLTLIALNGIKFSYVPGNYGGSGNSASENPDGYRVKSIHVTAGRISTPEYLRDGKKNPGPFVFLDIFSHLEDIEFKSVMESPTKGIFTVSLKLKEFINASDKGGYSYISEYMWEPGAPRPNLGKMLQKGEPIIDTSFKIGPVTIDMKENDAPWGNGGINELYFSIFATPDEGGSFFRLGYSFKIKGLSFTTLHPNFLTKMANMEELNLDFSIEPMTETAAMALIDLIRWAVRSRDKLDQAGMLRMASSMMQIMASKPTIKYSLCPLKHDLGELCFNAAIKLQGNFFSGALAAPEVRMSLGVRDIDGVLKRMRESWLFKPAQMEWVSKWVDKMLVRKANGDASGTVELGPKQPGFVIINGKSIPIPANGGGKFWGVKSPAIIQK